MKWKISVSQKTFKDEELLPLQLVLKKLELISELRERWVCIFPDAAREADKKHWIFSQSSETPPAHSSHSQWNPEPISHVSQGKAAVQL